MATATVKGSFLAAARQFTENLYHCSRCNYCVEASWEEKGLRHVCPTLLYHSPALSYSGKGYLATARALADGEELSAATVADRVFACTTCGNCEEACPIGLRPAQLVKAMRADLVDHGLAPDSALEIAATSPALAIRMACPPLSVAHGPASFRLSPAPHRNFYICPAAPLATANRLKRAPRWPC